MNIVAKMMSLEREKKNEESEGAYSCEGQLLMIKRTINNQPSMNHKTQRENIFHT